MKIFLRQPTVKNVAAGSRFTAEIPVGRTIERLIFQLGGTTFDATLLNLVRVLVNGKVIVELSGAEILALNDHYNRGDIDGNLFSLWFTRPEMNDSQQRAIAGLGTADVQTLTVEGDIAAGAVAPTVTLYSEESGARNLGAFVYIRRFPRSFAAGGFQEIDTLPRNGAAYLAMHVAHDGTALTATSNIELSVNGNKIWDMPVAVGNAAITGNSSGRLRHTITNYAHLDFNESGDLWDALNSAPTAVKDMRLRMNLAAAGSLTVITEALHDFRESAIGQGQK